MKFTQEEEAFVRAYEVDGNPVAAAMRIGYPQEEAALAAAKIMESQDVLDGMKLRNLARLTMYQKAEQNLSPESMGITINQVLYKLKRLTEVGKHEVQLKALELIGKHLGMFQASQEKGSESSRDTYNVFNIQEREALKERIKNGRNGKPK
jgi:hypothetical protein